MSRRQPFGWFELSPEAQALLRDQPQRFERVTLTDGPVAHGRLFAGPRIATPQPELFDEPAEPDDDTGDLFA